MKETKIHTGSSVFSIGAGESRWVPLALKGKNRSVRYGFSPVRVTFCLVVRKKEPSISIGSSSTFAAQQVAETNYIGAVIEN
ncbi:MULTISPECIES: hypothetical protein [Paenibacillus]|uniref:hypothetical protein n=1 Tax=Paenibacillus TaxID=44249 RepID=UPI0011A49777|nr:hypothetical protein [Paenibacillus sp. IHBB 10380]